jgi:transposase
LLRDAIGLEPGGGGFEKGHRALLRPVGHRGRAGGARGIVDGDVEERPCVREVIEAAGARLRFLPPYRADLNPIEQSFAKLEALLCTAARRTVDALWNAIGSALDAFRPDECLTSIANCGHPNP